jgi:hypothetical protein
VVPKHNLLLHGEIQLRGVAGLAEEHTQGIERLPADFFRPEKMIAPRLIPQIHHWHKVGCVANAASGYGWAHEFLAVPL